MTTLNLAIDNIEVIAVETSRTIYRVSTMSVFHFTLYMKNGDVFKFNSLSAGIKLMGTSTLNGKRVAVKSTLDKCGWYKDFNSVLIRNDKLSDKLHECYFVEQDSKMKLVEDTVCEFKTTVSTLVTFEEALYKGLQGYKYDNFNISSLESWLKATWANLRTDLEGEDKTKAKDIIIHIRNSMVKFNEDNPQFRGSIKKGIVLYSFYQVSNLYGKKYKELNIERKATYSYGLFLARLFGYLNFRTKQKFDAIEFREMIVDFVHRENSFIQAENDDKLKQEIKSLYKAFISNTVVSNTVYKGNAINVLKSLTAHAAP